MADVKSRLTQDEVEELQHLLGSRSFSLLYKASVHGYNASIFHAKCDAQGPTVAVAYNGSGYIFGGFTCQSYVSSGGYISDEKAFLFRLKGKEGVLSPLKIPVKTASGAIYDYSSLGPNFGGGALQLLNQNAAAAATSCNNNYTYNVADLHGNDLGLTKCEVYRVEVNISSFLESPWRKFTWTTEERGKIMEEIRSYKPYLNSVPQIWILSLGPVEAGKSSFFNSVNSVFRGYVTRQAIAGSDNASVTTQYRTYPVKDGSNGKPLPIILCDTMGIEEKSGTGLEIDEVSNIIKGHVPDRYQFNPAATLRPDSPGYIKTPSLKDQIHCFAFVIDGCKIEILPEKLEDKLKQLRRKVNQFGIRQLVLLTKVDEICSTLEDVKCVYNSKAVEKQMWITAEKIGIPLAQIVPVKNYCSELDLSCDVDILLLSTVRQLMYLAESYLDNFPFEKPKEEL
ncbi:interferon-induced protein 44-like [Gopherus flavomarginatus]|uniref:interferon-induced protein 44-like n=1 Tax=Gopherus flavomarginatus TaxID=286002 RepID=UPI0021CBC025|nr:interferon-induced protein 44-like [Gopherus flavomarginatus]